ncbi:RDD family protein [Alteromonas sp. a30]|uniref:RDD family protein n=1 Tax=Alteromonas sp. a30 TaxID=2730917 RepID=UPI002282F2E4|nr:RDD family protein [Alteromonas sp. a30]MCY7296696.1 RDD family protein [Alteromonas sp. a30]
MPSHKSAHKAAKKSSRKPSHAGNAHGALSNKDALSNENESPLFPRAGFLRRLAAMIYDLLVAVAVGMVAAMVMILTLVVLFQTQVLDMGQYQHLSELIQGSLLYRSVIQVWVAIWVLGFFLWFWRNGGQTIGMRAWRMRLFSTDDQPFTYKRALFRVICSLGGIGTLLVLFDFKNKQSLQDRLAHTEMLVLTKSANDHKSWKEIQQD